MNKDTLQYIKDRANENETGSIKAVSCADVRDLIAENAELIEALKNALARMEENKPAAAKPRDDMHKVYARAVFYRDLEAARAAIAKATK